MVRDASFIVFKPPERLDLPRAAKLQILDPENRCHAGSEVGVYVVRHNARAPARSALTTRTRSLRKTDDVVERIAGAPIVAKPADPRQTGLTLKL